MIDHTRAIALNFSSETRRIQVEELGVGTIAVATHTALEGRADQFAYF